MLPDFLSFLESNPVFRREDLLRFLEQNPKSSPFIANKRLQPSLTLLITRRLVERLRNGLFVSSVVWQESPDWLPYALASRITKDSILGLRTALSFHLQQPAPRQMHIFTAMLEDEVPLQNWTIIPINAKARTSENVDSRVESEIHRHEGASPAFVPDIRVTTIEQTLVDILDGHLRRPRNSSLSFSNSEQEEGSQPASQPSTAFKQCWKTFISCWKDLALLGPRLDFMEVCNQPRSKTTTAKIGYFFMVHLHRFGLSHRDLCKLNDLPDRPHYWAQGVRGTLCKRWNLIVPGSLFPRKWKDQPQQGHLKSRLKPGLHFPDLDLRRELCHGFYKHGITHFREGQETLVRAVLEGKDAIGILPTGAGKSLTYQFPSTLLNGPTLIISPLISLMADQEKEARAMGLNALSIKGSDGPQVFGEVIAALEAEILDLLFTSPESWERVVNELPMLGDHLAQIVIDEAHLIASWGQDFRSDYKNLGSLRQRYPQVPILALTATCTRKTRQEITESLQLREGFVIQKMPVRRPHLFLQRKETKGDFDSKFTALLEFITLRRGSPGIVYCTSRKDTDKVAEKLRTNYGFNAQAYHAQQKANFRHATQMAFMDGELDLIVATVAFGMGVNKKDIRWVVHFGAPPSLDNYVQEVGRAGRDGQWADCLMLYSTGGWIAWKERLEMLRISQLGRRRQGPRTVRPTAARIQDRKRDLGGMRSFAQGHGCLHRIIDVSYLDPDYDKFIPTECLSSCDNCCSPAEHQERVEEERLAIEPSPPLIGLLDPIME